MFNLGDYTVTETGRTVNPSPMARVGSTPSSPTAGSSSIGRARYNSVVLRKPVTAILLLIRDHDVLGSSPSFPPKYGRVVELEYTWDLSSHAFMD